MSRMKQVEAAVGEGDAQPLVTPAARHLQHAFQGEDLCGSVRPSKGISAAINSPVVTVAVPRLPPRFLPRCSPRPMRDHLAARRESERERRDHRVAGARDIVDLPRAVGR